MNLSKTTLLIGSVMCGVISGLIQSDAFAAAGIVLLIINIATSEK